VEGRVSGHLGPISRTLEQSAGIVP
jgi:hypothetical protein